VGEEETFLKSFSLPHLNPPLFSPLGLVRARARAYIQRNAEMEKKRETFEKVKI